LAPVRVLYKDKMITIKLVKKKGKSNEGCSDFHVVVQNHCIKNEGKRAILVDPVGKGFLIFCPENMKFSPSDKPTMMAVTPKS